MSRILIVEDKQSLRAMLCKALQKAGYVVEEASSGGAALEAVSRSSFSLVLTDLRLPDISGIDVLKKLKAIDPDVTVVVMTAYGSVQSAVEAMKAGAYDFLQKPIELDHLLILIARALERKQLLSENFLLKEELAQRLGVPKIVGEHPSMIAVGQQIQQVAPTNATVLLLGESGTGKELFAKAIHNLSPRKNNPFVTVNCAAIPETLIENELFGHERGAYTGASERRIGRFELANRGTIFLDEIGEVPLGVQSKILRVIEEKRIERIGGNYTIDVDIRIVAATNRDLRRAVAEKQFREDLYFRISVFPILIPPLRERKSDIPLLVRYFLDRFGAELNRKDIKISDEAMRLLTEYDWPGNVRELRNCIERALIVCDGETIRPEDLHLATSQPPSAPPSVRQPQAGRPLELDLSGTLREASERALRLVEREKILAALAQTRGNKLKAARILNVSYKTLLTKMKEHGL